MSFRRVSRSSKARATVAATLSSVASLLNAYMWSVLQAVPNARNRSVHHLPTARRYLRRVGCLPTALHGRTRVEFMRCSQALPRANSPATSRWPSCRCSTRASRSRSTRTSGAPRRSSRSASCRASSAPPSGRASSRGSSSASAALNMFLDDIYGEQKILQGGRHPGRPGPRRQALRAPSCAGIKAARRRAHPHRGHRPHPQPRRRVPRARGQPAHAVGRVVRGREPPGHQARLPREPWR